MQGQLQRQGRGQRIDSDGLRRAIRLVADDAHRQGLRPEQFLKVVKAAWATLPESQRHSDMLQPNELLSRIISLCIDAFYADAKPAPDARDEHGGSL